MSGRQNQEISYDKYENRLRTYSAWPIEAPVFIKDLVEAGLVYTGNNDVVFCFRCGVILKDWQENEVPLQRHEFISTNCPYLGQRKTLLETCRLETSERTNWRHTKSNDETSFFWDSVSNKLMRNDTLKNRAMSETRLSPAPLSCCSSQHYNTNQDTFNCNEMRSERARLDSFIGLYQKTFGPKPAEFAKAGFFYLNIEDDVACFCCDLTLRQWQVGDNPFEEHIKCVPSCKFIQNLPSGNIPIQETDVVANQPCLNSGDQPLVSSLHLPGPTGGHDIHILHTPSGEIPDVQFMSSSVLNSGISGITHPFERQTSSQSGVSDEEVRSINACRLPSNLSRSSSFTQSSPQPGQRYVVPSVCPEDMSNKMARLQTFFSWPQDVVVRPVDLAEAGFYYTKINDGVVCFQCGIALKNWSPEDTAWGEHEKWSPRCVLVQEHQLTLKQALERNEIQTNANDISGGNYLNPFYNSLHIPPPSFNSSRKLPSPEGTINTVVPLKKSNSQSPAMFQYTSSNNEVSDDQQVSTVVSNITVSVKNAMPNSNSEKHDVEHLFDYDYRPLLDMGFSIETIKGVLDIYSEKFGTYFSGNVDELVDTILYHQENGCLSGVMTSKISDTTEYPPACSSNIDSNIHIQNVRSTQEDTITVVGTAEIKVSSDSQPSSQYSSLDEHESKSLQEELKRIKEMQLCKICMDAEVGMTFLPCGHLIACPQCAIGIAGKTCPMCRATIQTAVRTYLS